MKQSDNTSLSYFKPFINYNNFLPNNKVAIRSSWKWAFSVYKIVGARGRSFLIGLSKCGAFCIIESILLLGKMQLGKIERHCYE